MRKLSGELLINKVLLPVLHVAVRQIIRKQCSGDDFFLTCGYYNAPKQRVRMFRFLSTIFQNFFYLFGGNYFSKVAFMGNSIYKVSIQTRLKNLIIKHKKFHCNIKFSLNSTQTN